MKSVTCKHCSERDLVWGKTNAGKFYIGYPVTHGNSSVMPHRCNAKNLKESALLTMQSAKIQLTRDNFLDFVAGMVKMGFWSDYLSNQVIAAYDAENNTKVTSA